MSKPDIKIINGAKVTIEEVDLYTTNLSIDGNYTIDEKEGGILEIDIEGKKLAVGQEIAGNFVIVAINQLEKDKFEIKSNEDS